MLVTLESVVSRNTYLAMVLYFPVIDFFSKFLTKLLISEVFDRSLVLADHFVRTQK